MVTGGKFAAGIVDTGGNFAIVINNTRDTGVKIYHCTGVIDTCGAPWLANISTIFDKIWNDPNIIFRGLKVLSSEMDPAEIRLIR